ncbi:MAG: 2-alkenal reductase [Deltaproteobacteria bacterium]|nr:MAG: 2-alkenal reductase [Deltaproteobacteria bacterium]
MSRIIGIDLGTTNSCAAYTDEAGKVHLIPYKDGTTTIPSIFAVDDKGNELVGHEAKRQWQLNPRNTVYASKRLIGRNYKSEVVDTMSRVVAYEMKPSEHRDEVLIRVGGKDFHMSEIAARILNKVRSVAQDHLNEPVMEAVVTVPAYFTDKQRQAVKDAGDEINLKILRIINEPTAAALAYGVGRSTNETVCIYDLGGGTFDVSIIEIRDRVFEVKATGGDIFLGGIDFDNALIQYVLGEFKAQHDIDLSTDPVAMQRIKDLAERSKIDLSGRESVPFNVPFITMTPQGMPLNIDLTITRQLFEELTQPLIERTLHVLDQVMADAEVTKEQIGEVMLVGGQSRMPLIHKYLTEYFGKPPSKAVHPDEAVAIGAALYAHSLNDDTNLRIQLLDVIPMAIGLEAAGGRFHEVFARNASIPNAKAIVATTSYDGQTELAMRIYQGDGKMVSENELLGDFLFEGIKPGPKGSVRVEVTFDLNVEGILTMSARDPDTGREMKTTVQVKQSG